jgi:hypothetical protein
MSMRRSARVTHYQTLLASLVEFFLQPRMLDSYLNAAQSIDTLEFRKEILARPGGHWSGMREARQQPKKTVSNCGHDRLTSCCKMRRRLLQGGSGGLGQEQFPNSYPLEPRYTAVSSPHISFASFTMDAILFHCCSSVSSFPSCVELNPH